MKRWKWSLVGLLIAATFATTASANAGDPIPPVPTVSAWAQEEVNKANELGLVPEHGLPEDYRTPITRRDFGMLAMEFVALQEHYDRSSLKGMVSFYLAEREADGSREGRVKNVFTDGNLDDSISYYLGLVEGRGNGIFDPEGLITRQEAAVMLTRAYSICGGTFPEEEAEIGFTDEDKLEDWARESIAALSSWNVMSGKEEGSFSPEGQYSVEQCIITFLRLYENAPVSRKHGNVTPLFTYEQGMEYVANTSDIIHEKSRIEGPVATFVRMDMRGMLNAASIFSLVYRDGGVQGIDLGVYDGTWGFTPRVELENPRFSEDGRTFYCTVTLWENTMSIADSYNPEGVIIHEKGIYHITIDVDTCQYKLQKEALPA